jgi:hypothetical protein
LVGLFFDLITEKFFFEKKKIFSRRRDKKLWEGGAVDFTALVTPKGGKVTLKIPRKNVAVTP